MNRRGFLGSILMACAAPAIVRADSLMKIVRPTERIVLPGTPAWLSAVRELRVYDVTRDVFMTRWDIAGKLAGARALTQYTVAMESAPSAPMYVVREESISVTAFERGAHESFEGQRDLAIRAIADEIRRSGLVPQHGILELPASVQHARFLA